MAAATKGKLAESTGEGEHRRWCCEMGVASGIGPPACCCSLQRLWPNTRARARAQGQAFRAIAGQRFRWNIGPGAPIGRPGRSSPEPAILRPGRAGREAAALPHPAQPPKLAAARFCWAASFRAAQTRGGGLQPPSKQTAGLQRAGNREESCAARDGRKRSIGSPKKSPVSAADVS